MSAPVAPPEAPFEEPWQARLYALAVDLHARGRFAWPDFSAALGRHIAASEDPTGGDYWECWYAALTELVEPG